MSGTELLAASAWKGSIILAAAFAASVAMRRRSASFRHFLWAAAFAGVLALPAVLWFAPAWSATAPESGTTVVQVIAAGPAAAVPASRIPWLLWLWLAGMLVSAARFAAGVARTQWIARRGQDWPQADDMARVRVLLSDRVPVPLVWGLRKPMVLLPAQARKWPLGRLRTVLLHECEHIRRHDLAAQIVAQAACSLYWFQPLAWWAWREFRKERERACDDAVLARGVAAHEYAAHLIEVLREAAALRNGWADVPAMAEPSGFESRVKALLDRGKNRSPLSRRAAVGVAAVVLLSVAPMAMIHAQSGRAALAGIVTDPSGARIPGCKVIAHSTDGSREEVAIADAAGEYAFASIPSGPYALEFLSGGFAAGKASVTLVAGAAARSDMRLDVGSVTEQMIVEARRTTPAPRSTAASQRIKVGGNVTPLKLISQTKPMYSEELRNAGVEGTVVIRMVVSNDGTVLNPVVVNTVDSRLAQIALDAVRQWTYEPSRLDGEPIEVSSTITLRFRLSE